MSRPRYLQVLIVTIEDIDHPSVTECCSMMSRVESSTAAKAGSFIYSIYYLLSEHQ